MSALTPSQIEILRSITSNNTDNYWIGYQYVRSIVEDNGEYSDFEFWLGKGGQINSNDIDSTANTFIRAVTRYGLIFDGNTGFDLQHNSNLIGNAVIRDLLRGGEIPPLSDIVEQDVSQAITDGHQSIAGWGGSFFYWDFELDGMTVGDRIAGDPMQFEKFITIAAKAALDTVGKHGISVTDLFEYLSISLQAQVPTDIQLEIISRLASGNPNGSPDAIDLNINGDIQTFIYQISQVDNVGHWMIPVAGTDYVELTDAAVISTLNQLRELRTDLADNPVFNTANPDLGVVAGGGLQAMLDDSRELVAAMENVPASVSAMLGVQTGLADLAAWYADRLTVLDLHDPSSTGVLSLDTSSAGVMQVEFSAWLNGVIQHTGVNSQGDETGLTEAQQLVPKEHALDAVYSALSPNGVAGQEEKAELDTAASIVWGNGDESGHVTAAKELEYFAFEANNGSAVSLTARTSGGVDLSSALVGGSGNDLISGKDANDLLVGRSGNDAMDGGKGDDIVFAGDGNDTVLGGDGNDYIDGGVGNDVIHAGYIPEESPDGTTPLTADVGNDRIDAGTGDDKVYVSDGEDVIALGAGSDEIYLVPTTPEEGDFFPISTAHTVVWGGDGADKFHFMDGVSSWNAIILYADEISAELVLNIDQEKLFATLQEELGIEVNYVILNPDAEDEFYDENDVRLDFEIRSEQDVTREGFASNPVRPAGYDMDGYAVYEYDTWTDATTQRTTWNYYFTDAADGQTEGRRVYAPGTSTNETTSDDPSFSVNGADYTSLNIASGYKFRVIHGLTDGVAGIHFDENTNADTHTLTMDQYELLDYAPYGYEYNSDIDAVIAEEFWDYTTDTSVFPAPLTGTLGAFRDTIVVNLDEPVINPLIDENYENSQRYTIDLSDFQLTTGEDQDPEDPGDPTTPPTIVGSNDDDALNGTGGDDVIQAEGGNDTLQGLAGDDVLQGSWGSDTYIYAAGDGSDTIDDAAGFTDNTDVLVLSDINASNITLVRYGNDLAINITATGETISVNDQFYSDTEYWGLERIDFADGSSWDRSDIQAAAQLEYLVTVPGTAAAEALEGTWGDDVIRGYAGNDTLLGSAGSDIYIYASGDGSDLIGDAAGFTDNTDVLVLKNLNAGDLTFVRYGNDLAISNAATGETITVNDQFYSESEYWGLERIDFADGSSWDRSQIETAAQLDYLVTVPGTAAAETLTGTFGDDVIRGFGGNDTLLGDAGSDIYIYASGDGSDLIDDAAGFTDNTDVLVLKDVNADDLTLLRYGDDLTINITATGTTITVNDQFRSESEYWGLERIDFADGSSWDRSQIETAAQLDYLVTVPGTTAAETLTGTFGDDVIRGFGGNDTLLGDAGNDIYIYASGDGSDLIDDEAGFTDNTDILVFKNLNAVDLSVARTGDDLAITVDATGETITVDEQFYSETEYWGIERIDFADGSSWDRSQILLEAA